ncbi:MAG: adenylate/guanylate cyclase domain-containing protein [Flavobacteriaceae bacterium]
MRSITFQSKHKSQLRKIAWITLFWVLINMLQFFTFYSTLLYFDYDMTRLNLSGYFTASIFTGLVAGLIGGGLIVLYWEKWLRTKSYGRSLLHIFLSYTAAYFIIAILGQLYVNASQLDVPFFHSRAFRATWMDITSLNILNNYLFWLVIVIITLIALLVNDKYGPGVFVSFLLGKYFHPRREERIFMFLDLRGSTTIAEKLGEDRYFAFLKEVYKDVTPGILHSKGEIYQYVGDEIVISWKTHLGTKNANALRCFFTIRELLQKKASYYNHYYDGIVPEFKAGLHHGDVMAGEIGIVKRDICFSGDVLNTTARIQSKCNELGVDLLISSNLLDKLRLGLSPFKPTMVGEIALRGKQQTVTLYTV